MAPVAGQRPHRHSQSASGDGKGPLRDPYPKPFYGESQGWSRSRASGPTGTPSQHREKVKVP